MSQVAKLIDFMTPFGRTITARQARQYFGVQNLSARVREMRIDGLRVISVPFIRKDKTRAVKYRLVIDEHAQHLRECGLTYSAVGDKLGITGAVAWVMCNRDRHRANVRESVTRYRKRGYISLWDMKG